MLHAICYVLLVQYDRYDDACYSHGMTMLIQFWNLTNIPNPNSVSTLTCLSQIMLLGKRCSYSCMSLVCACIYQYLVQAQVH